jgi:hypothetical protein
MPRAADLSAAAQVWREASGYDDLRSSDRRGFAWEWVRRDCDYRAAFANNTDPDLDFIGGIPVVRARLSDDASRWGLLFRRTARPPRQ